MSSEQPLRLGLIGCGFFAQNHLHAWHEMPDVTLSAVCDLDPAKAETAARAFDAPRWYTDAATMLANETLDFVDVITTPPSHRSLVELAAHHKVAVICQKPMAWSIEDAQAMVAACKQADVPFMVHENFRWQTPMREIRRLLDDGIIGRPFFGRLSFRTVHDVYADQPWFLTAERFIVLELAVHLLDLARFFFGEPRALFCHSVQVNPVIKGEDAATIMLTMDGANCVVDCSFTTIDEPDPFPETFVTLEGPGGTIHLDAGYQLRVVHPGASKTQTLTIPSHSWYEPPWHVVQDSVFNIQRHWVECLRAGREPETSGADNLRVLELVFGAYESAERGAVYHITG